MKINRSFEFILLFVVAAFALIEVSPAFAQTGTVIGGFVYNDANQNGLQDAGEAGMAGVAVTLNGISQNTTSSGFYSFGNLPAGMYTLELNLPVGYFATTATEISFYVSSGFYQVSFGIIRVGVISGVVFEDANENGLQDAGEAGAAGVTVELVSDSQNLTSITSSSGAYLFNLLSMGNYSLQLDIPAEYKATTPTTINISITSPGQNLVVSFGIIRVGVVSGVLFDDKNENGIRDVGEKGLGGVTVKLDSTSQVTNFNGSYLFRNLALGEYIVEATVAGWKIATTPNPVSFNLTIGEPEYQVDFGLRAYGAVGGLVYDSDTGLGVTGVNVTLSRVSQSLTYITRSDGSYVFDQVFTDSYTIELSVPVGYVATTPTMVYVTVTDPGSTYTVNFGILRDVTSPITNHDYDGSWHTEDFNIALAATDTQTGVAETFYRINEGPTRNVTADGQPRIMVEGANNTLEYWSVDNAGNEELPHKTLAEIKLDKTAPSGSVNIDNEAEYANSTSVTLNLTAADATSGTSQIRLSNDGVWDTEQWEPYTTTKNWTFQLGDGEKTVYYQIRDNAGLTSTIYSDTITIDTVAPVGSILVNDGATYTASTGVSLALAASDDDSGISQVRFSNDGTWDTEQWETPTSTKSWTLNGGDGLKTVYYQVKDNADVTSVTYTDTIMLDSLAPTGSITINSDNAYTASTTVTLSLTASDATSGVYKIRLGNDGVWDTEQWEAPSATKSWALLSTEGAKTVYYQIMDNSELVSSIYMETIILDMSPPQGSIQINDGASYTNTSEVTLALSANDAVSGVSQMRFSNGNNSWSAWEPYATLRSWTISSEDGAKQVFFQVKDKAGLVSSYNTSIILDVTEPIANLGKNLTVTVGSSVAYNASASTDNTGLADYLWDFGDGTTGTGVAPTHVYAGEGTYTVRLVVHDLAGNSAASSVTVTIVPVFPLALVLTIAAIMAVAIFLVAMFALRHAKNRRENEINRS